MSDYSTTYRPAQIRSGLLYQDFIVDLCYQVLGLPIVQYASKEYQINVGETRAGVEIKYDKKYSRTGNLWIELAEKAIPRPGPYAESGINRPDNSWLYVIGDYDTVFVFGKNILKLLSLSGRYKHLENHTETSIGFLLPRVDAVRYADIVLKPQMGQKISKTIKDVHQWAKAVHRELLTDPCQPTLFNLSEDGRNQTTI